MDTHKTESPISYILSWLKKDVTGSILLLTGVILIMIIGVSLTSWWAYPLEDLQEKGFIRVTNPYGVNTSGFSITSLEAVNIALRESVVRKMDRINVRPSHEVLLENRTVLERESWEVHLWHSPLKSSQLVITWAFIDPFSGQVLSMVTEDS